MNGSAASWSIPGYDLGPALGRGGFATVYRARQISLDRDVAIKILSTSLTSPGDRRRFDREREALGRLSTHPHIVDVHDAGVTAQAQHPFLVMRLYPGGSVAERLRRRGRLPLDEVCTIVTQVASALDHAHAAGVIHRDVKPANILLDERDSLALTDFGISGILRGDDAQDAASANSTLMLTFTHAAPEVINGDRASVASDVYSLAATAYQLLTGVPVFSVRSPADLLAVLERPPAPITVPGVPGAVSDAVLAALAKVPADRPASAGAFATALAAAAALPVPRVPTRTVEPSAPDDGPPGQVAPAFPMQSQFPPAPYQYPPAQHQYPPTQHPHSSAPYQYPPRQYLAPPPPVAPAAPRRPAAVVALVSGIVVLLIALVGGGLLWSRGTDSPTPQASATDQARPAATGHLVGTMTGHTSGVQNLAWSPDGKTLATASNDKTVRLWNPVTRTQVGKPLTGHTDSVSSVAWSPDGKTLASSSYDGTVRLWAPATGAQLGRSLTGHDGGVNAVAWSPDGKTLATAGDDKTVRLWDPTAHVQVGKPLTGHTNFVFGVAWSPDGKTLATASNDDTVRLWNPVTGTQIGKPLTGHTETVQWVAWSPDGKTLATASNDDTVRLWNPVTGTQIGKPLTGHADRAYSVAWSPDGKTLATASGDETVRLWNPATGTQIGQSLTGHTDDAWAVAWSPDGRVIAATGRDSSVRLWSVS